MPKGFKFSQKNIAMSDLNLADHVCGVWIANSGCWSQKSR
jgi:hypothetical protein